MLSEIAKDAKYRMNKSVELFIDDIKGIRGGRVSASLLDGIQVKVYGGYSKLNHISSISVVDNRTLSIKVWDKNHLSSVKESLVSSELGVVPSVVGDFIMITLPGLTKEGRVKLIKMLKKISESTLVAIRNVRRDLVGKVKSMSSNGDISEDDSRLLCDKIQKLTDDSASDVSKLLTEKEREIESI